MERNIHVKINEPDMDTLFDRVFETGLGRKTCDFFITSNQEGTEHVVRCCGPRTVALKILSMLRRNGYNITKLENV